MSMTSAQSQRPRAAVLTRDEARRRAETVCDVRYEVALDLTGDERVGTETVVRFRTGEQARETFLDYVGVPIRVTCNGREVAAGFDGTRITIPVEPGENEVRVTGAAPYGRSGSGMHRFVDPADGQVYLHTKFQPFAAHRVFPCFDQPDLKAVFTLEVTAPASWQVITNTAASDVSAVSGEARRWRFEQSLPMPPYLAAVAAGPFQQIAAERKGMSMTLYARPSLMDSLARDADELLDITSEGLDYFEEQFGRPYPFGKKYDLIFAPEYAFGAMEHPGAVTANERFLFTSHVTAESRRRRSEVLLHEMAHMWFGNLVTPRWWDDLWLSESFAVWAAAAAQAETGRFSRAWEWFAHDAAVTARRADQLSDSLPVVGDAPDTMAARMVFNPITYRKGAALLRQLSAELGRDKFLRGLRRYLDTYAWGNAGLPELVAAFSSELGSDLNRWAEVWLRQPGVGAVTGRVLPTGFEVAQLPDPRAAHRTYRLDVGSYAVTETGLAVHDRATVTVAGTDPVSVEFEQRSAAASAQIVLPNDTGVAYAKVVLDRPSRQAVLGHLSSLDDPLTRAVVWSALWDDVHDGRLPAREYVKCVINHADAEPDDGVVELLWERALVAASTYGDPTNLERVLGGLFRVAAREVAAAEPASDRQLVWARMVLAALPAADSAPVYRILQGESPWPGVEIDADLRWRLLHRLAVIGAGQEALIESALMADPSWNGHCRAIAVRAACPDPMIKEEAWRLALDGGRSLTERQAAMSGFPQATQEHLLLPYVERYFDALPVVWDSGEQEIAIAFTRMLYPRMPGHGAAILERTDAVLGNYSLPAEARRILREERSALVALRAARACDAASE